MKNTFQAERKEYTNSFNPNRFFVFQKLKEGQCCGPVSERKTDPRAPLGRREGQGHRPSERMGGFLSVKALKSSQQRGT